MDDIPPSILKICPVIHCDLSSINNSTTLTISSTSPILCNGCLFRLFSIFFSLFNRCSDNGVLVIEGATTLTLTFGASSAAKVFERASIPPFEIATCV